MKQNKAKKTKFAVVALALVLCLGITGLSAYLTDSKSVTNTFTVGDVALELTEPNYPGNESDKVKFIAPNQTIAKDPTVTNSGDNAEFVFMQVAIPYKDVVIATEDGKVKASANTELFTMNSISSDDWHFVGYLDNSDVLSATPVYRTDGTVTYLYAYGTSTELAELAVGASTSALFSSVTFANIIEGELTETERSAQSIVITAYGIQTSDIAGGTKEPSAVWGVVYNQVNQISAETESTESTEAAE